MKFDDDTERTLAIIREANAIRAQADAELAIDTHGQTRLAGDADEQLSLDGTSEGPRPAPTERSTQ